MIKGKKSFEYGYYAAAYQHFQDHLEYLEGKGKGWDSPEYSQTLELLSKSKNCLSLAVSAKEQYDEAISSDSEQDWREAYSICERLLTVNATDRNAKQWKDHCKSKLEKFEYEKTARAAWKIVDKNNADEVNTFIKTYSSSAVVKEARERLITIKNNERDNLLWSKSGTLEDYKRYLIAFPNGLHVPDANYYISHWEEITEWKEITSSPSYEAYTGYLKKYPSGMYKKEARQEQIKYEDDMFFNEVTKDIKTRGQLLRYKARYPAGKHLSEIDALYDQYFGEEDMIASACINRPSLDKLKDFEERYPQSAKLNDVYDAYALYLCNNINEKNWSKKKFNEAYSYAKSWDVTKKIKSKEVQCQNYSAQRRKSVSKFFVDVLLYVGVPVLIVIAVSASG